MRTTPSTYAQSAMRRSSNDRQAMVVENWYGVPKDRIIRRPVNYATVDGVTVRSVTLDKHTATQLRKAAKDLSEATERRNHWIHEAHSFGASLREIAEHAGITHVAVMKIIRRGTPRKDQP
jgi:hypothetical protein